VSSDSAAAEERIRAGGGGKSPRNGRGTECLLHLCLHWKDLFSTIAGA